MTPDFSKGYLSAVETVSGSGRWTPHRKSSLVRAVKRREITVAEAEARYGVTAQALAIWTDRLERLGSSGLRQTRLQDVRVGGRAG